ncbi:hypothetical protein LSUE1_G004501 [Lachnellula suecica]|uniref:Uncharacterized protein n=1 Tax=Lachnellula suecica TaxID=602035 RepID=A0A8T9C8A0_9HELO|nr:hypothetical protein LSUE1_G004501 [Lachnellula suecica]
MSGSGGYYKYRCKYFFSHNCPHWVWVHNAPCAHCLADGRDSDAAIMPSPFRLSREVYVPQLENGALHYIIMEIIANSDADSGWTVKNIPNQTSPIATGPTAVSSTVTDRIDSQKHSKSGLGVQGGGAGWSVKTSNPE